MILARELQSSRRGKDGLVKGFVFAGCLYWLFNYFAFSLAFSLNMRLCCWISPPG